jgi:hypothetical protein
MSIGTSFMTSKKINKEILGFSPRVTGQLYNYGSCNVDDDMHLGNFQSMININQPKINMEIEHTGAVGR